MSMKWIFGAVFFCGGHGWPGASIKTSPSTPDAPVPLEGQAEWAETETDGSNHDEGRGTSASIVPALPDAPEYVVQDENEVIDEGHPLFDDEEAWGPDDEISAPAKGSEDQGEKS